MLYTVGEIAKILDVTASTLRYYDKEGLLPFTERSNGGMRMFREEDIPVFRVIECLKRTGMPLKDIKHFMECCAKGDETIDERLEIIKAQRQAVLKQMDEQREMLNMLDYKCWYYEAAQEAGTCEVHRYLTKDDVPEEFKKYV